MKIIKENENNTSSKILISAINGLREMNRDDMTNYDGILGFEDGSLPVIKNYDNEQDLFICMNEDDYMCVVFAFWDEYESVQSEITVANEVTAIKIAKKADEIIKKSSNPYKTLRSLSKELGFHEI